MPYIKLCSISNFALSDSELSNVTQAAKTLYLHIRDVMTSRRSCHDILFTLLSRLSLSVLHQVAVGRLVDGTNFLVRAVRNQVRAVYIQWISLALQKMKGRLRFRICTRTANVARRIRTR